MSTTTEIIPDTSTCVCYRGAGGSLESVPGPVANTLGHECISVQRGYRPVSYHSLHQALQVGTLSVQMQTNSRCAPSTADTPHRCGTCRFKDRGFAEKLIMAPEP